MCFFRLLLCLILKNMKNAEKGDIDDILRAVMRWQNQRFPDYELVILSLPKYDKEEREKQLGYMVEILRKYICIKTDFERIPIDN